MRNRKRRFSRRTFMESMAGFGAAGALSGAAHAQQAKRPEFTGPLTKEKLPEEIRVSKPNGLNLIVIICDTFRWDHLSFTSGSRIKTPNIEALAEEGVYFENCYADGLPTIPSRRVMHTGRSILKDKNKWWRPLEKNDVTFAEVLQKAGFTTGFVVDTYHHFKPDMNFHRGFNSWLWIRGQESDPYKSGPRSSVNPEDYSPKHLLNDYYRERITQYILNTKDRKGEEDYFCARSCRAAARWLEENKDNEGPFMLFIDMFDPHEPWDAPPRFKKMYRDRYPFERYIFGYGVRMEDIREDDIPVLRDLYAAEVTFSDYCIGKLLDKVKSLGLWDDTIIVFSTDHGTHLGEDGCVQKQAKNLKSCVARIPLIIRHPDGSYKGKRVSALTSHMDFMPTFLSLLGVEGYTAMDGRNMWDLVTGNKEKLRDHVVTGYANFAAVHTHEWHYFQNFKGDDPGYGPALFHLPEDRLEEKNVIATNKKVVAEMKTLIEEACDVELG